MNSVNHRTLKFKGFLVISSSNWLFYRWESWGPLNVQWLPKVALLKRKRPRTQFPCDQLDVHDMTPASLHRQRPEFSFRAWHKTSDKSEETRVQCTPTLLCFFTHNVRQPSSVFLPTFLTTDLHTPYTNTKSHHKWLGFWPFSLS